MTGWLIAAGGGLLAILVAYMRGRLAGASKERDKARDEELAAREIAAEVDNDVGAMPPDAARKELGKWSK